MASLLRRCGSVLGRFGPGVAVAAVAMLASGAAAASPGATVTVGPHGVAQAAAVKLEVRPWGEGRLTLDPPGTDSGGVAAGQVCDRSDLAEFEPDFCERYYPPGTRVTVTATARAGGAFLGWSDHGCSGTGPCRLELEAEETMLLGRFTPQKLGVRMAGSGAQVTTDPPGLACTDGTDCLHPFPVGQPLAVVSDRSLPAASWPFGCRPAADGRRCAVTLVDDPHWVGVGAEAEPPGKAEVLFSVARSGEGAVKGREIDCGSVCDRRYRFGEAEELLARPAQGWRFTQWRGECEREQPCRVVVGPVTSVGAIFARNLAPRLLAVSTAGTGARRRLVVRLSVQGEAQARVVVRRLDARRALIDRRFPLRAGPSALTVPIPRAAPRGRYRITIAVSDGQGGGRTFQVTRPIGR
jgi:hypothetical protein